MSHLNLLVSELKSSSTTMGPGIGVIVDVGAGVEVRDGIVVGGIEDGGVVNAMLGAVARTVANEVVPQAIPTKKTKPARTNNDE